MLPLPAQPAIDHCRLRNWGRWLRSSHGLGQAQSLEGEYRTRPDDGTERPLKVDPDDAWQIELACRVLPLERHLFLKLMYATPIVASRLCEVMRKECCTRLTVREIEGYEAFALSLLAEAMQFPAVVRMELARRQVQAILMPYLTLQEDGLC